MAERKDIAAIQARLIASYPNYHPADHALVSQVWLEILGDLPSDLLKAAVLQYSSESHDFAPSAGTIRAYAFRIQAEAAGVPDAYQAYNEVATKPTRGPRIGEFQQLPDGTYGHPTGPVEWTHPLVERVATLLGWPHTFPSDNPVADRAQFAKAWDAQINKYMTGAARLPVVEQYIEQSRQSLLLGVTKLTKQLETK